MSRGSRALRQTLTIARRDFVAAVFTPAFLIFLLTPLIMMSFGLIGGLGAASMAGARVDKTRLVAIVPADRAAAVEAVDRQLRTLYRVPDEAPPALEIEAPQPNPAAQANALFRTKRFDVRAVLYGPLDAPVVLYGSNSARSAGYLASVAEQTLRAERSGGTAPLSHATKRPVAGGTVSPLNKGQLPFFAVLGLFLLTLMIASQSVGTMAEEKSNKVIEILAAAIPLESVFLGKLVGMFGIAALFIGFWGTLFAGASQLLPGEIATVLSGAGPAVGLPAFVLLYLCYYAMGFLLLGAVFLSVGAQAGSQREIQMLTLPLTIFQMSMFGLASAAASQPDSWVATVAEVFPFSSPFAMAARAANSPELWRHLLALAWQLLWVSLTIALGARWFRRGVLQSGSPRLFRRAR